MQEATHSAAKFQYRPLQPQKTEIRILLLLPAEDIAADIHCRLCHESLDDENLAYEALSYVWGPPETLRKVQLDGQPKEVTPNLFAAMRQLRHPRNERRLWVDALSVDQMNNEEKSLQIGLMGSIYSRSRSTIIWLGDEDEAAGSKAAMEHLIMLCNVVQYNEKIPKTLEDEHARGWVALQRLLYRSYWKRIWIVQEVLLSPKAVVYCGTLSTDWSLTAKAVLASQSLQSATFAKMLLLEEQQKVTKRAMWQHRRMMFNIWGDKAVDGFKTVADHYDGGSTTAYDLAGQFSKHAHGKKMSLLDALVIARERQTTDDRDRIYGLLGVIEPHSEDKIIPDYSKSIRDLYQEIVLHIIADDKNLDILSACKEDGNLKERLEYAKARVEPKEGSHTDDSSSSEEAEQESKSISSCSNSIPSTSSSSSTNPEESYLPTWVPDWRNEVEPSQYILLRPLSQFCAAGSTTTKTHVSGNGVLKLNGISISTITHAFRHLSEGASPFTNIRYEWQAWCLHSQGKNLRVRLATNNPIGRAISRMSRPKPEYSAMYGNEDAQKEAFRATSALGRTDEIARKVFEIFDTNNEDNNYGVDKEPLEGLGTYMHTLYAAPRFFITKSGYMGRGPSYLAEGDLICVFFGGKVPFIVRPVETKYFLIGECCECSLSFFVPWLLTEGLLTLFRDVHGIMSGEAAGDLELGVGKVEDFELI
jgi:Heterokaryon incompatibility protein (HET)